MNASDAWNVANRAREARETEYLDECISAIDEAAEQGLFETTMPYMVSPSISQYLTKLGFLVNTWTTSMCTNNVQCGSTRISWADPILTTTTKESRKNV